MKHDLEYGEHALIFPPRTALEEFATNILQGFAEENLLLNYNILREGMKIKEDIFQMRLQFVCTVTAEAHVTDSRIIFGNWVEDGETDTLFELPHDSLCY